MHEFVEPLFQILIYGGIVLGIFVILLINSKSVRKSRANIFLSVLLGAFVFSLFHIRFAGNVINHFSIKAYNLGDPTFLMIAPLLWFYTQELTGSRVKFSLMSVMHFMPVMAIISGSLSFKLISSNHPFIHFLNNHPRLPMIIFWIIVVIQFSWYQLLIHQKLQSYQQLIRQEVSNTENINVSWVRFFMTVFLIINVFLLFGLFAVIHLDYVTWLWRMVGVVFSLSVFALGYKGILQREVFFPDQHKTLTETTDRLPAVVIPKPDQQLIDRLIAYMVEKRPYLDSELTLSKLAQDFNISRSQLSQLINDGIGQNFYDFVNTYRIEEVKKLMTDPSMQNFNMLGIALEAGFKSKSTFNLIFKRFTGLTPSEYKKNISA